MLTWPNITDQPLYFFGHETKPDIFYYTIIMQGIVPEEKLELIYPREGNIMSLILVVY